MHWILVITLTVSVATGLRIAMDSPDQAWLIALDNYLPLYTVWTRHIPAAVTLVAISLAYALYVHYSGLMRRIRLDHTRLTVLRVGRGKAWWGAINVALYWVLFATMIMEVATGGLLWFGYGRDIWVKLHFYGTWIILGYAAIHVSVHWALGGARQLTRVFRPRKLLPPHRRLIRWMCWTHSTPTALLPNAPYNRAGRCSWSTLFWRRQQRRLPQLS